MLLITEVQAILECAYRPTGLRIEECIIGPARCERLRTLTGPARIETEASTFLRTSGGNLLVAVYYHPALIQTLESEDPREQISHRNIRACIAFIEEVTHAVHASLLFLEGKWSPASERMLCDLETLARIDTWWVLLRFAALLEGGPPSQEARQWIEARIFQDETFDYSDRRMRKRYELANRIAHQFIRALSSTPASMRTATLRHFRSLSLAGKLRWLRAAASQNL